MTANLKIKNIKVIHAAFEDKPVHIANYKLLTSDQVFMGVGKYKTEDVLQNVWQGTQNIEIIKGKAYGHRSTSVGDYMVVQYQDLDVESLYICENVGFRLIQSNHGTPIKLSDCECGLVMGSERAAKIKAKKS